MTTTAGGYYGIDVGKGWLDLAVFGSEEVHRVKNDVEGISKVVAQMAIAMPQLVVVEASGGYEMALVEALQIEQLPIAVANPTRVRALAKAEGKLAKTDKIDTRMTTSSMLGAFRNNMATRMEFLDNISRGSEQLHF